MNTQSTTTAPDYSQCVEKYTSEPTITLANWNPDNIEGAPKLPDASAKGLLFVDVISLLADEIATVSDIITDISEHVEDRNEAGKIFCLSSVIESKSKAIINLLMATTEVDHRDKKTEAGKHG